MIMGAIRNIPAVITGFQSQSLELTWLTLAGVLLRK